MIPSADRFVGCLLGQCVGDAMGFVVEGQSPEDCAVYAREVVLAGRLPQSGPPGFAFGQYSDDSQLARELMLSLAERGGLDPGDYAARIARLFAEDLIVGRGHTTSQAAERLQAGVPWDRAGTPAPAAGNGSAIRAAPIGLFYAADADRLVAAAADQARITHADSRCLAGAVVIAAAAALAARGEAVDRDAFIEILRQRTIQIEPTIAAGLRQLQDWLDLPEPEAAAAIARAGLPPGVDSHWRGGISAFVVASVLWALYAFLRTPENYLRTIATAIWPGGDVDTTAAMAGALSGAHLGVAAIPAEAARRLTDRGSWGRDELAALAERCHAAARG